MKKIFLALTICTLFSTLLIAQSVGINNNTPHASAILDIKSTTKGLLIPRMLLAERNLIAAPATGLLIYQTDNTPGYYYYNGTVWTALASGGATNYWTASGSNIFNNNAANVGIGTATPTNKLQIGTFSSSISGNDIAIGNGVQAMSFYQSPTTSAWYTTTNFALMPGIGGTGNVGIGVATPTNKLQIGTFSGSVSGNDIAIGNGTQAMSFYQSTTNSLWYTTTNFALMPGVGGTGNVGIGVSDQVYKMDIADRIRIRSGSVSSTAGLWLNNPSNSTEIAFMGVVDASTFGLYGNISGWGLAMNTNTGNVGIKTLVPTNKLQVGLGAPGYNGNDLVIGNGTNAIAISQSNTITSIVSSTNINLRPIAGSGRVGINNAAPRAPLDVVGSVDNLFAVYSFVNVVSGPYGWQDQCYNCTGPISIYASDRVAALEFDAYSDARIKNIIGASNTAKDLQTINALQITDYTLKDKVKNGNKTFKKVIAQEVEKVYPQIISKHTDFIPNVYQLASKIEKTANGWLLSFANKHTISSNAKKLRVLLSETEGMQEVDIVSIPSGTQVIIRATEIKIDKIFVYGEEVDDFRTVDYEGLTTLNISATQELSKLIAAQNKKIAELEEEIKKLKAKNY